MTIDDCKKCDYYRNYVNGAVHCGYDKNIVSMATVLNPKLNKYILLSCPKERNKKQ